MCGESTTCRKWREETRGQTDRSRGFLILLWGHRRRSNADDRPMTTLRTRKRLELTTGGAAMGQTGEAVLSLRLKKGLRENIHCQIHPPLSHLEN